MHGGVKFYRGSPKAARAYVEADHARADDYYLAEGTSLAQRYTATSTGAVVSAGLMDGPTYEQWVAGHDVETGVAKGRLRDDPNALRFVEIIVNGPKSWSLVAALHPDIAAAYDGAQDRAATEIVGWLGQHATTRVGPRGLQVQVPVERIEAAVIRHYSSRAGDPHRHLHLQINARVFAQGAWRGLHSVGVRDDLEALNGIGHAAVMCDPGFRTALAVHGYTLDENGEVEQLNDYAAKFSSRSRQIRNNIDRYEAAWRTEHPGQEPGPTLQRAWDHRAWADARPDKIVPRDGVELVNRWNEELAELGFTQPAAPAPHPIEIATPIGWIDRAEVADLIPSRLGVKRSAWNAADIRGEAEKIIATLGVITSGGVRGELAEDITARTLALCQPLLARSDVPEHIRGLTSERVLGVEAEINDRLAARADTRILNEHEGRIARIPGLDKGQRKVVKALTATPVGHTGALMVVEGAAGAGKTTTLAATQQELALQQRRLVVLTPTLKASQAARAQVGSAAFSAAWFIHQHGYRWDTDGHRTHQPSDPAPAARLRPGDVVLVDEAGMLDQDTALALLRIADHAHATIALVGDRHQLPAVGRGGVLDHAARWARFDTHLQLEVVHRFSDPDYAALSLRMRTGENPGTVFDELVERGQIRLHGSEVERTTAIAALVATALSDRPPLVVADTREQVARLNEAIRDHRPTAIHGLAILTSSGERLEVGDRVATRRNDRDLGVANRDTWTITSIKPGHDSITVTGGQGVRELPAAYVHDHVELAYATTAYGAQGDTVAHSHLIVGETTGAASAYVAMTRGRHTNTAHLIAEDLDNARQQWITVFGRDRADLGPAHAAGRAIEDIDRYGPQATQRVRRPPEAIPYTQPTSSSRGFSI